MASKATKYMWLDVASIEFGSNRYLPYLKGREQSSLAPHRPRGSDTLAPPASPLQLPGEPLAGHGEL